MADLFTQLQKAKQQQDEVLEQATPLSAKEKRPLRRDAHAPAQVSKNMSKPLSTVLSEKITQEAVEELAFRLRKTQQGKINANIPLEWREKFDDLAYRLKVGKYELLTYIVGMFLGEVEQPEP